jgi:hypothetical protein
MTTRHIHAVMGQPNSWRLNKRWTMLRGRGTAMRRVSICSVVLTLALFALAHSANAHGIAGNRFFVGTLTFDDPSIADEAIVPNFSTLNHSVAGGSAIDNRFD